MTDNKNPVSKEFPKLFHYTSVSAFKNIYKENIFRATHHEDLNDKSEFRRFRLNVCEFIKPKIREMFDHFIQGSTLVKHHAFHEEKEVRIVVSSKVAKDSIFYKPEYDGPQAKIIRYMQKGDRETRFIELFGHEPLPIERVIIGPSRIQNFNFQEVSDLVQNSKIKARGQVLKYKKIVSDSLMKKMTFQDLTPTHPFI